MKITLSPHRIGNHAEDVVIPTDSVLLEGELDIPPHALGLVIFAHGSGSSRNSPRNQFAARVIREAGVGTLLFDLLTKQEEIEDRTSRRLVFNIDLLADRLEAAAQWADHHPTTNGLRVGFYGSSTGGAAALVAAARLGRSVGAVVSRGGRPDLAGDALVDVVSPTLLIVGGLDDVVLELNKEALALLRCEKALRIVPDATHLFEEPGTLEQVAQLAADWFREHL
ncbi:MAG: dienelactone hydrolase family protein [Verrucomicrobia bacterium]|nr:dienelactone hydrolase family protein [Verrucomicrobiota bacterium]